MNRDPGNSTQIAGAHFDLECHFVHGAVSCVPAMLCMFIRPGAANLELDKVFRTMPPRRGQQIMRIQPATQEAVAAIKGIVGMVGQVSQTSGSIAAAGEEQCAATAKIARNMQQAANETGLAASQLLGAAGELSKQVEALSGEVSTSVAQVHAA